MTDTPGMRSIADDLSGAAECAAVLAGATGVPVPVVLAGDPPADGSYAVDTDGRAVDAGNAAARLRAAALRAWPTRNSGSSPAHSLPFKKIDSTLRGHVAVELATLLELPDRFDAAVVCPALPDHGRIVRDGHLHVGGLGRHDGAGLPVDLRRLAADGGLIARRIDPVDDDPERLAEAVDRAIAAGDRLLLVDAVQATDLRRVARALHLLASARILPVGSAGLAHALAQELAPTLTDMRNDVAGTPGRSTPTAGKRPPVAGPTLAIVGSFSPVSEAQVRTAASDERIMARQLEAEDWIQGPSAPHVAAAIEAAIAALSEGRSVLLAVRGDRQGPSNRAIVQALARAAAEAIGRAATLVLTGGDTARTVLEQMRVERFDVVGELEPGVCIGRAGPAASPWIVTKAGGFGDPRTLQRLLQCGDGVPLRGQPDLAGAAA